MDLHALVYPALFLAVALIAAAVLVGTRRAIVAATPFIQSHFSAAQLTTARTIAGDVVRAAEQVGERYGYSGKDKYRVALNEVRVLAAAHGIVLTNEQWESLIEAAVFEVNQIKQAALAALTPPVPIAPEPTPAAPVMPPIPPFMVPPIPLGLPPQS